jgi:NitT/TauT family transport system permease protein
MKLARDAAAVLLPPVVVFAAFLLAWQIAIVVFEPRPFLVPAPGAVAASLWENAGAFLRASAVTSAAALLGLLASIIVGVAVSCAFSQSILVQRGFYPYAIFLQTAPIVAIAPLIVIWFGFGFHSVVLASFIVSLFPIVTTGTAGMTALDRNLVELFSIHNASRWQVLTKLRLPNALPQLVTGIKTSSGLSVIGAIIGEFFVGVSAEARGLGYWIEFTRAQLRTADLIAAILCTTVLGLVLFGAAGLAGKLLIGRWHATH